MANGWIDYRVQHEFQSIAKLLLHFSISLFELSLALSILALQILLIITQTCVYSIGMGFWSMPILLLCPISIWIVIWRRSSIACFLAIVIHFLGTLLSTSIIVISFLALIGRIDCSNANLTRFYVPLNSSLIGIAGVLKILIYSEVILLFRLRRNTDEIPTIFTKEIYGMDSPFSFFSTAWSTTSNGTVDDLDSLVV